MESRTTEETALKVAAKSNVRMYNGDVFKALPQEGFVLAHISNDIGKWGAGFSKEIDLYLSEEPREAYLKEWPRLTPGTLQLTRLRKGAYVASLIAQHGVRTRLNPTPIRYSWLSTCLRELGDVAQDLSLSIFMPRIGAGLAGGEWKVIEGMIRRELEGDDKPMVSIYLG